jgi:putative flavoprotein involved in K+ transport
MSAETVEAIVVGGGQAGLAMSEHLSNHGVRHLILERDRIAERWRTVRWDSLVMNGPAWHDRFPTLEFPDFDPDDFPQKDSVVAYFEAFAEQIKAPIRCGVDVREVRKKATGSGFEIDTSEGLFEANHVVAATGPFQVPVIPPVVPPREGLTQMHSSAYRNPEQLADGAVLVVGAGSSGSQIADELLRAGRRVYLSIGAHDRPPRRYRGKDFVYWLGVLGKWEAKVPKAGTEHVTIAVSGAYGGHTIDFRRFAARGMTLLGMTRDYRDGVLSIAPDLATNIARGDANYLALLDEADAYVASKGLDFPDEPDARVIGPDPDCVSNPILELDLAKAGITTIIWATGFTQDFSWLKVDAFDQHGRPEHRRGVSAEPGIYFLGLPWLSMRGSSFIWGVWEDARYLAEYIASQRQVHLAEPEHDRVTGTQ